jgi:hypothetical protein
LAFTVYAFVIVTFVAAGVPAFNPVHDVKQYPDGTIASS